MFALDGGFGWVMGLKVGLVFGFGCEILTWVCMYVVELEERGFMVVGPLCKKSFDTEKNVGDKIRHLKGQVV